MTSIPFFLTPNQRDNAGWRVRKDAFELARSSKAGVTVKRLESGLGFHNPMTLNYSIQSCQVSTRLFLSRNG